MTSEVQKCYNYLVAEYLNMDEENRSIFLDLKAEFETPKSLPLSNGYPEVQRLVGVLSCYSDAIVLKSLNALIEVFDIKYTTIFITGTDPNSPYISSGVIPNYW